MMIRFNDRFGMYNLARIYLLLGMVREKSNAVTMLH